MYKRGETVWVLHEPYTATTQKKFIQVKIFSGEERIGIGQNSRCIIHYKHHGTKHGIDIRFVDYTKNSLINKLSEQTKKEFEKSLLREEEQIKKAKQAIALLNKQRDELLNWFNSQKEEE